MIVMARMPDSVKTTLTRRLETHRAARWPQLTRLDLRYRGEHAYVDAVTTDDDSWPLCRLRYTGTANRWASRSTWPAATATKTRSCPAAFRSAPPRRHSTVPAAST